MEKKFSRSTNFSTREENILISLVKKYKGQVECKKSDTNTNKIKADAWVKISKEINSNVGEPYRSEKVLKNKYDNIKKRAKQKFADHKKYITGTGGGPSKDILVTNTDSTIHEILGSQLTGLPSQFDSDAAAETIILHIEDRQDENYNFEEIEESEPCVIPDQVPDKALDISKIKNKKETVDSSENTEFPHNVSNWAKYTPSMLKKPLSRPLQTLVNKEETPKKGKNSELSAKLQEWAMNKSKYTNTQEQVCLEKHLLTMELMKEKHTQHMDIQKEESNLRKLFMTEEHNMKIKIFEKELNINPNNNNYLDDLAIND